MGKPTGFLEWRARCTAPPRDRRARARLARGRDARRRRRESRAARRPLHGLRRAVLHAGLPARQSDPRLRGRVWTIAGATRTSSSRSTNEFPEFTGRLCPAPCEAACVLASTTRR